MKRNQKICSILTSAALCSVLVIPIASAQAQTPSPTASPGVMSSEAGNTLPTFVLGSKLMNAPVKDLHGTKLGTVSNVVINADTGHIRYAVVDANGKKVTIPWGAMVVEKTSKGAMSHLVVDTTKAKLANAPKFTSDELAKLTQQANEEPIFSYYELVWFPDTMTPDEQKTHNAKSSGSMSESSPAESSTPTPSATPH